MADLNRANEDKEAASVESVSASGQKQCYTTPHLFKYGTVASITGSNMAGSFVDLMQPGTTAAMPSDRRLKSNIVKVGVTRGGLNLYEYDIFGRRERGVMADEVELVMPAAVSTRSDGYKQVDYGLLGVPYPAQVQTSHQALVRG